MLNLDGDKNETLRFRFRIKAIGSNVSYFKPFSIEAKYIEPVTLSITPFSGVIEDNVETV